MVGTPTLSLPRTEVQSLVGELGLPQAVQCDNNNNNNNNKYGILKLVVFFFIFDLVIKCKKLSSRQDCSF